MISQNENVVQISRAEASSALVIVCEHASHFIPAEMNALGLSEDAQRSHIAWDPGALPVAQAMADALDATLVAACVSRLVYDCNRPPEAPDAMPAQSEAYVVPGNANLSALQKVDRVRRYYEPFCDALDAQMTRRADPIMVTIHSFTPVYHGQKRDVEIGILHDDDTRLADALLQRANRYNVRRNDPYGPEDGVTHTLKQHAVPHGHLNVMIEVRNDLIATPAAQAEMAQTLTSWLTDALQIVEGAVCRV